MKYTLILLAFYSLSLNAQIVTIPDANFKTALLNHTPIIDANSDGEIQETEAEALISSLNVANGDISDITGIEAFINLEQLFCGFNTMTVLDLSANINLQTLSCSNSNLTELDLSSNTALNYVRCSQSNSLTSLNVVNSPNLTQLYFNNTSITTIDLSNNTLLEDLICKQSLLTELDLTNNINLIKLECYQNRISTSLDLSTLTLLKELKCYNLNFGASIDLTLPQGTSLPLEKIDCSGNLLNDIDVSNFPNLEILNCGNTNLDNINVSNNTQLKQFVCGSNNLLDIDVSNNTFLEFFNCGNNPITSLDLSENTSINNINVSDCNNLLELYLRNGNNQALFDSGAYYITSPNLQLVCLDDINSDLANRYRNFLSSNLVITDKCNAIRGNIKLDANVNGCDDNDDALFYVKVTANDDVNDFATFTQANGDYTLYMEQGSYEVNAAITNSFVSNPLNYDFTFSGIDEVEEDVDFCITTSQDQPTNDLSISAVFNYGTPRPGYESNYRIILKNEGNVISSGTVVVNYNSTLLSIISTSETISSQTSTSIHFDYSNLNPLETRVIDIVFEVAQPPTAMAGDVLSLTTTINPVDNDVTPNNNVFNYNVTLVDSYDPNDIGLARKPITLSGIGESLHYRIRFQNEGTAEAINIRVTNELDAKLDWSTFQLENTSHKVRVSITNENVTYNFENINLPDSTTDEKGSHGFIAFKIKLKNDIGVGDVISSQALIYFDFNSAVPTNVETVEVVDTAAVSNYNSGYYNIYPNPTKGKLDINTNQKIVAIDIYNNIGELLIRSTNQNTISIATLINGLYFIKITDSNGNVNTKKIMKE